MTRAEDIAKRLFPELCEQRGLPRPVPEYRFAAPRKFRFDYAWPEHRLALECDGGVWTGGRHTRGSGWLKDTEKLNIAASIGWRLLRCTPKQLASPEMLDTIKRALNPERP